MTSASDESPLLQAMSRRRVLGLLAAAPAAVVAACSSASSTSSVTTAAPSTAGPTTTAGSTATTSPATSAAATATTAGTATTAAPTTGWAVGGTDLITVGRPDTELFETSEMCDLALTDTTTEGPCYFASDTGPDISHGKTGLPMQLSLRVVDSGCAPLAGQIVEVWHCDTRGYYSGDTSESADASRFRGGLCTDGDAEAEASDYHRGQLTTDADGRVDFLTCFPGWYPGRTIHFHVAVSGADGGRRLVSQFAFTDELCDEICTEHELYADRGLQDTPLSSDGVFRGDGENFLLNTRRNADGTLLGYSTIRLT